MISQKPSVVLTRPVICCAAAQQPADVEVLRPQAGDRYVAALEPGDRGVEDRLVAAEVGDQRAADPAEAPHDERSERQHDRDRDRHRDRQREERGHPPLQPVLHRPDESDDENTERQRREDDAGLIGGDGNGDRRDEPDRNIQGRKRAPLSAFGRSPGARASPRRALRLRPAAMRRRSSLLPPIRTRRARTSGQRNLRGRPTPSGKFSGDGNGPCPNLPRANEQAQRPRQGWAGQGQAGIKPRSRLMTSLPGLPTRRGRRRSRPSGDAVQ